MQTMYNQVIDFVNSKLKTRSHPLEYIQYKTRY